jgi:hypothetical protein
MTLDDEATRDKIARALRLEPRDKHDWQGNTIDWSVLLPVKIGQVAADFDEAQDILGDLNANAEDEVINLEHDEGRAATADEIKAILKRRLGDLKASDRKLLEDMLPYIEASEGEAWSLATHVVDGKIVL